VTISFLWGRDFTTLRNDSFLFASINTINVVRAIDHILNTIKEKYNNDDDDEKFTKIKIIIE